MKKVLIEEKQPEGIVYLDDLGSNLPIFAKKDGKIRGMICKQYKEDRKWGWVLALGNRILYGGFFDSREACCKDAVEGGYELFVDI